MEKKEGYKKTAIGWIPEDWDVLKFEKILVLQRGFDLPVKKRTKGKYPLIASNGVIDSHSEFKVKGPGVITGRSGTLGKVHYIENEYWPLNTTLYSKEMYDNYPRYLYYFLKHSNIAKYGTGTGVPTLNRNNIHKLNVARPPLPEQKKIADILTTVDDKISSIYSQIQQNEQLKKGLMEKLLTEGIGHTEFKETEIGRVPVEWDVVNINKVSDRKSGHTPNRKKSEYWNGGIKWVSLADTFRLDRRYIEETEYNISEAGILNSSAVKLKKGAVIISRDAGIGKSSIIGQPMAVSQHFIAWECGNALFNLFLFYLLQKWKPKFERIANGTTIKTIGLDFFKKMEIPLPTLPEQKQIATILSTVDDKLDTLTQKKSNYQTLKKGLSQQLLTGQMRVKV